MNGHYQDNWLVGNLFRVGRDSGKEYWGSGFSVEAQKFFNDFTRIGDRNYIDGSSSWGGDMSGQDRYEAGYEFAKTHLKVLTEGMIKGETIKMVTHSEGSAYGAGMAQLFIDKGYKVEKIVHLSSDEGDEFRTPKEPITYQLAYQGDWLTRNLMIKGVDKFGLVKNDLGIGEVHGITKNASVFNVVQDLVSVQTQDNIGFIDGAAKAWKSQVPGTTENKTEFTNINGVQLSNPNGSKIDQ